MADTDIAVTSLGVTGGAGALIAQWGYTGASSPLPYLQLDHFQVWVASSNDRSLASKATDTPDLNFTLPGLSYSVTRYFWVRAVDVSGNLGDFYPLSATAGISATTKATAGTADIADGAVTTSKLDDAAVNANKLATDAVTAVKIAAGAVEAAKIAVAAVTSSAIDTAAVIAAKIATGAVTTIKIAADAVTALELANNAVDTAAIQTAAVTSSIIANNAVQTANINALAVTAAKVANATITAAQIANTTITAAQIVAATITGTQIANTTIAAGNIVANTITAAQILSSTITTTQIAANTILAADIAAGTITATEIAASTITAAKIAAGTITATEIAAATITGSKIAAGTITASNITAGTITATEIAAATITGAKIAAATIAGSNVVAGTLSAREIVIADLSNMLPDPYWENIVSIWDPNLWSNPTAWSTAGNTFVQGGRLIQFTSGLVAPGGNTLAAMVASKLFPVTPGENYAFGASINNVVSGGTFNGSTQVDLVWVDATGANISASSAIVNSAAGAVIGSPIVGAPGTAVKAYMRLMRYAPTVAGTAVGSGNIFSAYVRKAYGGSLIVDGAITAAKITAGTITASQVANGTITATQIAGGTITTSEIAAGTITAANIASGTITGTQIAATTITGAKMVTGTITARELYITNFSNMMLDDQFQTPSAWTIFPGFGASVNTGAGAFTGSLGAINITGVAITGQNLIGRSPLFAVHQGDQLALHGAVVLYSNGPQASWYLVLNSYDSAGNRTATDSAVWASGSPTATGIYGYDGAYTVAGATSFMAMEVWTTPTGQAAAANAVHGGWYVRKKQDASLIVDGAITAAKVTAGTVTADLLVVGGKVVTAHVTDDNITTTGNVFTAATSSHIVMTPAQGEQTVQSLSFTPNGGKVTVKGHFYVGTDGSLTAATVRLKRDGVTVQTITGDIDDIPVISFAVNYIDTGVGTTNRTWTITIDVPAVVGGYYVFHHRYLEAVNFKK